MLVFGGVCSMLIFRGVIKDYTLSVARSHDASHHEDDNFFLKFGESYKPVPIGSMHGICSYIWLEFIVK